MKNSLETIFSLVDMDLIVLDELSIDTIKAIKIHNVQPEVVGHIAGKRFSDNKKIKLFRSIGADMAADMIYHTTI